MSICIAIAVPDGIALSADSQTTWNQTITQVQEKSTNKMIELERPIQQPISWSKMARKLFEIKMKEKSYAVCVAGAALLNHKTTYSIFKSFESKYKGEGKFEEIVSYFIEGLKEEMKKQLEVTELKSAKQILTVDFILAGYEDDDVSKPRIESHLVFSGVLTIDGKKNESGHIVKWQNTQGSRFGGCWIGRTEFISHLVTDNKTLPPIQGQYELLSLEDAVDYTNFLVDFTCEYQRFAIMVPDCGKPIISAKLTPKGYEEKII
ncbi:MAG: hypothetical protein NT136_02930 [Candidatus Moranbacteria bacterium]|nr:hypothetical protein [Candidatus Moranbacteria bacterium]